MGEMADLTLDQIFDYEDDSFGYVPAHTRDGYRCRYCGAEHLLWHQVSKTKKCRLHNPDGTVHTCTKYVRETS